ncbi:probable ATP-dependent RNA helicase DDX60 isoform X2 [Tiliqua scincoides]|uniref:probable ATP-dependent RNA helicase DDX60 isoform X2 n=1 Tax=Tiliqua scincoides TaxID=71010 RepID=UPI0034627F7D
MAAAETDSEEEFNEKGSYSDSSDSDFDKNEVENDFLGDATLPNYDDSSEMQNVEGIQQSFVAWKEVQEELDETCCPQDPGLIKSQTILKKLSVFIWRFLSEAKYVSILNDFVESEFFVIDGDSLLLRYLCDQEPYLTFVYSVECFLNNFIKKGAKFVIVFFKDIEQIYFNFPDVLFLRTLLIQHLEHNTDVILHTEFSNCLSPEWQVFLKESYPYFIIISDDGLTSLQTNYLNIFLSHSLSKKLNVVLTSGDSSDELRVYAYHVQSKYVHREFYGQHEKDLQSACGSVLQYVAKLQDTELRLYKHLKFNLIMMRKEVCQAILLLKDLWPEGADIRRAVCVLTCATGLKIYKSMLEKAKATERTKEEHGEQCNEKNKTEALTLEEVADVCRIQCLTVAFLCNLPLSQRAQIRVIKSFWTAQALPLIKLLQRCDWLVLKQLNITHDWKLDFTYLPDLRDNLLCMNLLYYYELEYQAGLKLDLGKEIENDYQHLWNTATSLTGLSGFGDAFPVRNTSTLFLQEKQTSVKECADVHSIGLIAVKSHIVEEYVGSILEDLPFLSSNDSVVTSLAKHKQFDERRHWHSGKPLSDDYDRTKQGFDAKSNDPKQRRDIQKYQSYYRLYGRSLEGNMSQMIVNEEDVKACTNAAFNKPKKSHKSKAEIIAEENKKRLEAKEEKKEEEQWRVLEKSIEKDIKANFQSGINRLDKFLKACQSSSVKFCAETAGLNACFEVWKEHCRSQGKKPKDLGIAVEVMRRIHMLWGKYQDRLQKPHLKTLTRCLQCFGFEKLAFSLNSQCQRDDVALLPKCLPTPAPESHSDPQRVESDNEKLAKYAVGTGAARFQLQYMGHYLFRDERSDSDPRVRHFIPDTWQRELLDVVDKNESAVIVAPTSSGKTYASYYCMEKVLRKGNDGVVVYVAPTKALVNQVVGVITNRFTKTLPDGLVLCGVFTRDYRHDTLNCQILVTVPQCLEILMLSPHRQEWVKKIKYVIFDEVHCLGGEIGAEVWEHLLVMIRCPFLALSATISNPEHLTEWLQSVKRYWQQADRIDDGSVSSSATASRFTKRLQKQNAEKKSYRVRLVLYGERYNDLEKYVCSLKDNDILIDHYHPCAALTVNHIEKYGIPSDIAFSPRESVQLYDAMLNSWPGWPRAQELEPEEFVCFKNKIIIKKADARKYEQELKQELRDWIVLKQKDKVNNVLESLKPHPVDSSEGAKCSRFAHFVDKLNEMGKLPAIFFMFNIHSVETSAKNIWTYLRIKQIRMKNTNTQKETENTRAKLNKMEKTVRTYKSLDPKKQTSSKMDNIMAVLNEHKALKTRLSKLTQVPVDCTYANNKAVDQETFGTLLFRLRYQREFFKQKELALRGIGYHHSAMRLKQRQFVEMLFRMGYLQVVTATGTLALGINMPCKSVVFVEDSVYLNALNYRQMSGRAGRRGQDLIGNVFFYDIPLPKVEKLMKSNVPELKGQFPLSITLILRLLLLATKANDEADAKAKVMSVLNHSLLSFKQQKNKEMLKIYFIFSLQFLLKEGYLNQEGKPVGYAGLVSHLHYHAPSNFVLVDFLTKGLFHKLCQLVREGSTIFSKTVMEKLVLVLAHLFGRKHLPACNVNLKGTFSQSKVFLDDLPEEFALAVETYNREIENNFGCFLLTTAKLADMEQEYHLPVSKLGREIDNSDLASHLMRTTKRITAISPFACLSGMVDQDLFSIHNVNKAVLRTLDVNSNHVPVLLMKKFDYAGRRMPLNAYALDFYKHGSLQALTQDNGLNRGEAYHTIKDFVLAIKAIKISLGELCENMEDNVVLAFKQLARTYSQKFKLV